MPFSDDEQIATNKISKVQTVALIIAVGLFVSSLFTVAFCTDNGCRTSLEVFLLGWLAMLTGGAAISWLANPFLILSWLLLTKSNRRTWVFGLLATVFAMLFLNFKTIIEDEAGHYNQITQIGLGYWLWLASCIVTLAGSLTLKVTKPKLG